jgi:CheY-like chemotaxis protein
MRAVLVVDDVPEILNAISEALSEEGWEVVAARSGEEAMAAARSRTIDVVLCDVLLDQGNDGLALRDEFARRDQGHIPFVFMTASSREAERLGAVLVLRKPFSVSEVVETLNVAVSRQENGRVVPQTVAPDQAGSVVRPRT